MLIDAELPVSFWPEAAQTATYLHQRTPTESLPGFISPHEALTGSPPAIKHLHRFGCLVWKFIPKELRANKFSERSRPCIFLGYVHHTQKVFRLWDFSSGRHGRAEETANLRWEENTNGYEFRKGKQTQDYADFPSADDGVKLIWDFCIMAMIEIVKLK
jgi:hypothetical protein